MSYVIYMSYHMSYASVMNIQMWRSRNDMLFNSSNWNETIVCCFVFSPFFDRAYQHLTSIISRSCYLVTHFCCSPVSCAVDMDQTLAMLSMLPICSIYLFLSTKKRLFWPTCGQSESDRLLDAAEESWGRYLHLQVLRANQQRAKPLVAPRASRAVGERISPIQTRKGKGVFFLLCPDSF